MIVLPNTPPLPTAFKTASKLNPSLLATRSALAVPTLASYHDSIRFADNLDRYLEEIFSYILNESGRSELDHIVSYASKTMVVNTSEIPWSNVKQAVGKEKSDISHNNEKLKLNKLNKVFKAIPSTEKVTTTNGQWTLENEIQLVLVAIAFVYIKIGSELTNELIDDESGNSSSPEINEKWKQVVNFYKKAISYTLFGIQVNSIARTRFNGAIFTFIHKISEINFQLSILCKSSWVNRNSFRESGSFAMTNNGTLSRVAIFVLNEIKNLKSLLVELESFPDIGLNYKNWQDYLDLMEKYASAYAGLFLAVENYQKDKLGNAIGLVHFSLLNLQSKNIDTNSKKLADKLKSKIATKKNEHLLNKLDSVSTLNINKSLFNDKSGVVLNDISYLFDQLIHLNLKLEKENNTLKFDTIVNWQDISKDSKWPLGNKIPVSDIKPYQPLVFNDVIQEKPKDYYGRGAYY